MSPSTVICDYELNQNPSHSCCSVCLLTKSREPRGGNYAPKVKLLFYVMRQLLVITVMLIVMRLFVLGAGNKIEIYKTRRLSPHGLALVITGC